MPVARFRWPARTTIACALSFLLVRPVSAQHDVGTPIVATSLTPEQLKADIGAFRIGFMGRDKSFSPETRAEAEKRLAALEAEGDALTPVRVDLVLAQVAALADNGHTRASAGGLASRHPRVGVRFTPFGEEFHVLRTREPLAHLLGARLVAIDAHPMDELRSAARTLSGGTAAWRDRIANVLLESPELLRGLGLANATDGARYTFVLADGRRVDERLVGEVGAADAPAAPSHRWLSPTPLRAEGTAWRALRTVDDVPWSLRDPSVPFRWRMAPEIRGVVLQLRITTDGPDRSIKDALNEMAEMLDREHPENVVLDMRANGGGDLNKARDFVQALPGRARGRVFVLTSPWTFSAAISSVGYLKQTAPAKVTIVGEPVGDRLMFWAEGSGTTLPNSKAQFGLATQRHDYQGGCKGYTDCHGNVVRFPIAVPSLEPDLAAPLTFESYAAGRDAGMEAIVAALKR